MRFLILCLFSLLWTEGAKAGTALAGLGAQTCAEFGVLYKRSPKTVEMAVGVWSQGFLSGTNFETLGKTRQSRDVPDVKVIWDSLRRYCDKNPLRSVFEGVLDLYDTLPVETASPPQSN
jgi:hypothetical protein